jgi:hypothetical protein
MGLITKLSSAVIDADSPAIQDAKVAKSHIAERFSVLTGRLKSMILDDRRHADKKELIADFSLVLRAWGMEESDIPQVINEMYIRVGIYIALAAVALALVAQGRQIIGVMLFICSCSGIVKALWRISVLDGRTFFSFPGICSFILFFFKKPRDRSSCE